jgi:hypothetical protein
MTQATVKISEVKVKDGQGPKGPWQLFALIDGNGNRHSTFDTKLGAFLQANVGALVDIETEQTERGSNLKSARVHAEEVRGATNGGSREMTIAREVALKAAVEWASTSREPLTWNDIILAADKFTAWIVASDEGPA